MKIGRPDILIAFICIVLYGCQIAEMRSQPYVAEVNGEKIYLAEFQGRLMAELDLSHDSNALKDNKSGNIRKEILDKLIDEKIMMQRAGVLSLKVEDDELNQKIEEIKKGYSEDRFLGLFSGDKIKYELWKDAQRRWLLLEKVVAVDVNSRVSLTDEEVQAYYNVHRKDVALEKRIHVLQILLHNNRKAAMVLKRLKRGEDFGKVAGQESISPEAAVGGDLRFFSRGVMPEAIDKAVFSLPVGSISGVVKSPYGYHIFKVVERDGEGRKNIREIKDSIRNDLRKQKEAAEYLRWMQDLRTKAVVKINYDVLNKQS
jgi:parvulin-like peptidyl-prolyl isomerase